MLVPKCLLWRLDTSQICLFVCCVRWDVKNKSWVMSEQLRSLVINVNFKRNSRTVFKSTSFAGYVGMLTGLKPVSFSQHACTHTHTHKTDI